MYKYVSFESNGKSFLKDIITLNDVFAEIAMVCNFAIKNGFSFLFTNEKNRILVEFCNGEKMLFIPIE